MSNQIANKFGHWAVQVSFQLNHLFLIYIIEKLSTDEMYWPAIETILYKIYQSTEKQHGMNFN